MNDTEINNWVKRLLLDNRIDNLTEAKTEAINLMAQLLVAAQPEYFEKKVSISNTGTGVFTLPSDCLMLKNVWDYGGNVGTISGAADNGSGNIRITHNIVIPDDPSAMVFPFYFPFGFYQDYDKTIVTIHDVGGCTEANGTWRAVYVDSTHIDLYGSTFSNAYTSGGKMFIEEADTYKYPVARMPSEFETANSETHWFQREDDIVVDKPDFENDLIILYRYLPSSITEIPARMHFGIYAYCALLLAKMPSSTIKRGSVTEANPAYETLKKNVTICEGLWQKAQAMASTFTPVKPANNISDRKRVKRWI